MEEQQPSQGPVNVKNLCLEYCSNSSVHGVRYFGDRERTGCEKFWWLVVFILSVTSCAFLIRKTYIKWEQTPVIVSFAEKLTPVWQIPFPAVTICPETKASVEDLNFTREFSELRKVVHRGKEASNKTNFVLAMVQLCERPFLDTYKVTISRTPNKTTQQSYSSMIREMSFPVDYYMDTCCMNNEELPECGDIFTETLTEEGSCSTFNGLAANELLRGEVLQSGDVYITATTPSPFWSPEAGYSSQASISTYPYRTIGPGITAGLSLQFNSAKEDVDYLCSGPVQGFKVHLHSPADSPRIAKRYIRIPMGQEVSIAVKPQIITTSDGLRNYSPDRRQCFFNHERHLRFFRIYTQDNCNFECLTNFTLQHCGCVKFSMPRTYRIPVCETSQMRCMLEADDLLLEMDIVQPQDSTQRNFRATCNCLPACSSVQYDVEITQTNFEYLKWVRSAQTTHANWSERVQTASLAVYYKEAQFMTSRRSELYGWTDFLANCGGLLGLFMGVSLLSLVELLYFCTVRPVALWRDSRGRRKSKEVHKEDEGCTVHLQAPVIKGD